MCYGCYEEYGKPEELTDQTLPVIRLIEKVYAGDNHTIGNCHIILDDWNLEDDHMEYVLEQDDSTPDEIALATAMKGMTVEERATALAIHDRMLDLDELIERLEKDIPEPPKELVWVTGFDQKGDPQIETHDGRTGTVPFSKALDKL